MNDWKRVEVEGGWIEYDGKGPPSTSHPFHPYTQEELFRIKELELREREVEALESIARRRGLFW